MDLSYSDDRTNKFISNVGLVTSNGPFGHNIMACEWTHQISHRPGLMAIGVNPRAATNTNIKETGVFGISIASVKQAGLSSIAGNNSGKKVLKIKALEELGFTFLKAKHIDTYLVKDAALTIECKVIKTIDVGSHTAFIGEIIEATASEEEPLAYNQGKYWKLTQRIPRPPEEELKKNKEVIDKHSR